MSAAMLFLFYIAMLAFDVAIFSGAAYLIGWCNWSAWWMLAAVCIACGANPRYLIQAWQGHKEAA